MDNGSSVAMVRRYPHETYEVVFSTFRGLWVWNASGVNGSKCIEDDIDLMDDDSFDGFPDIKAAERHAAKMLDEYEDEKGRWRRKA